MNEHWKPIQAALGIAVDGIAGPVSKAALIAAADAGRVTVAPAPVFLPRADDDIPPAGDERLQNVHPALRGVIVETSRRMNAPFTVIEGLRTPERQAQLVARGASKTQNSLHLRQRTGYAHAADLWPLDETTGKPLASGTKALEAVLWDRLRAIAAVMKEVARETGVNLEWGGDWGWDAPHFQLNRKAY